MLTFSKDNRAMNSGRPRLVLVGWSLFAALASGSASAQGIFRSLTDDGCADKGTLVHDVLINRLETSPRYEAQLIGFIGPNKVQRTVAMGNSHWGLDKAANFEHSAMRIVEMAFLYQIPVTLCINRGDAVGGVMLKN